MDILFEERLSPATFANNIVFNSMAADPLESEPAETPSVAADIYWRWEDDLTMEPQFLASGTAGKTLQVPFKLGNRSIRLFMVSKSENGLASVDDVRDAEQTIVAAPSSGEQGIDALFDFFTDATTTGTSSEVFYTGSLPAGTLSADGEKIMLHAAGVLAANGNDKYVRLSIDSVQLLLTSGAFNGTSFQFDGWIARTSATSYRYSFEFTSTGGDPQTFEDEVTGFDWTAAVDIEFGGRTPTQAGDMTATQFFGYKLPAAPVTEVADAVEFLSEDVTFLSEVVTFSP